MNVLTRTEFAAFCKARGINPKKKTPGAKSYELGTPINVGERKPAKYVHEHMSYPEGVQTYTLHPTAAGGSTFDKNRDYWVANDDLTLARFREMLDTLNPVASTSTEQVAA